MVYAVDFVINVMKELSSSEPVFFQRDRSLYIASAEGFGQVTYGLRTTPEEIRSWEERGQSPDIAESEDVIHRCVEDKYDKKFVFKKGEEPFLKAIAFGPDTTQFTLEEVTKAAQELAHLPDDGKIRMILHGIDVWVQEARVMDRDRYLELVREREDELIQAMERVGETVDRRDIIESYGKLKIPDCVIITPYLKVSLPRSGSLHLHRDESDSWTQSTGMESNYSGSTKGSILYHRDVDTYEESQFAVSVTLNARNLRGENEESLKSSIDELVAKVTEQLFAITSNMPLAQKFIDRMNAVHNKVCAPNIEWIKDINIGVKRTA